MSALVREGRSSINAVLSSPFGPANSITQTPIRHAVSSAETVSKSALDPAYVLTILVVAYIFQRREILLVGPLGLLKSQKKRIALLILGFIARFGERPKYETFRVPKLAEELRREAHQPPAPVDASDC